ncbi:hypothetical protein AGMMS50268_22480 [Spirochaetia bacterium]|nr:hypothetical protein AGMMS50268_22480 [Spirochaetia bacterium]
MNIADIQKELLRTEYPSLQPDYDPDIERYYSLRSAGQSRDALNIFESRLKPRYPDEQFRTALFRTYRSHDPIHQKLLAVAYRNLTERSIERIRRAITYITDKIENYNKRDVYSTIRVAEEILRLFPDDRYEAVSGIERFHRYSQALNLHVKSMEKAVELVRSYHSQSLTIVENELQRRERDRRQADRLRRIQSLQSNWDPRSGSLVDFSTVSFSPADLSRIEIPASMNRVEDQTLAYCVKYWNLVDDPAFERILFLYSRKYGKKNHDAYLIIRKGRQLKRRDDEILGAVMAALVTGYYYSVLGDHYLQQKWRVLKDMMGQDALSPRPAPSAPAPRPAVSASAAAGTSPAGAAGASAGKPKKAAKKKQAAKKSAPKKGGKPKQQALSTAAKKAAVAQRAAVKKSAKGISPVQTKGKPVTPAGQVPKGTPGWQPRRQVKTAGGSVSDRLRKLSGRSYDLYQDRFLTHARPAIRKILGAGKGIFFNLPEEAENLVYNFLRDHYADPYMDWAESREKPALAGLGFELESLNPVIDECFKSVRD